MKTIALALIAVLLAAAPVRSAMPAEPQPVMKVAVYRDGRITADGHETDLPALRAAFASLSRAGGWVLYYREGAEAEPHPNAMLVIRAIVEAKLPVSLSTKPDFSNVVLPDGTTKLR